MTIKLVKSIESEQTFDIVIRTSVGGVGGSIGDATHQKDYFIGSSGQQQIEFPPTKQHTLVSITFFDDMIPEGREVAILACYQQEGSVANFYGSVNATTTIFIDDNGDSK